MKNTVLGLIAILIIAGVGWWFYQQGNTSQAITTFEECEAAGHPVMESYPRQCLTPDGRTLIEEVAATPLTDGNYLADVEASTLTWQGGKTFIPGYIDRGSISLERGVIGVAGGMVATGTVIVDMTSISASETSNDNGALTQLEEHLKSDDFFGVETYPTAVFSLSGIEAASGANQYLLTGNLTIRDVTKPITIPATISQSGETLTVIGQATVDRSEFGVEFGSASLLQGLAEKAVIDDEFTLNFTLRAERAIPVEPDGGTGATE